MKAACVFCGSNAGRSEAFATMARRLGAELASRGVTTIYGGGAVGLMGCVADATLEAGGRVVGVIPSALLDREVGHPGVDLRVVSSMHERKALMADLSDCFIAMPGGLGTLEELFETWTWTQLGLQDKPLGLLDVGGYFQPLLHFLDRAVEQGFVSQEHRDLLLVDASPQRLLTRLDAACGDAG